MDAIKIKYDKFKKDLDKNAYLSKIEKITKIPKEYAVIGSILVVCILLFFRIGAGLICNLAGFIYPTYRSFKAIESTSSSDDTQWLVYWVFYAAFSIIDTFIDFLLQCLASLFGPSIHQLKVPHGFMEPFLRNSLPLLKIKLMKRSKLSKKQPRPKQKTSLHQFQWTAPLLQKPTNGEQQIFRAPCISFPLLFDGHVWIDILMMENVMMFMSFK